MAIYQGNKPIANVYTIIDSKPTDNYSTDEQVIGTWIDGKPLYKRTFVATSPSSNDTITNIITLDDAIEPVNIYGFLARDEGNRIPLTMYVNDLYTSYIGVWYRRTTDGNYIGMIVGGSGTLNKPVYVTIEYTKTTD